MSESNTVLNWITKPRRHSGRRLVCVGSFVLLLLLVPGLRKPVLQRYQAWDAERSMARAEEFAREGQWREVSARIKRIGGRLGNHYPLIKLDIESSVRTGTALPSTLLIAGFLHPEATSPDRAQFLKIALMGDDMLTFSRLYNLLRESDRLHPDIVFAKGQLLLRLDRYAEAAALAGEQSVKDATDTRFPLLQVRAILENPAPSTDFATAQRLIARLIVSDAPEARAAFGLLSRIPVRSLDHRLFSGVGNWLERQDEPHPSERLIAKTVEFAALPEDERNTFAATMARRFGPGNPGFVADWLISIGMEEKASPYFDIRHARDTPANYNRHLNALLTVENWEGAREWLADPPSHWEAVDLWLMRARLAQKLEEKAEWRRCLEHAFFSASIATSQNHYFTICDESLRRNDLELAARAALQGVRHPMAVIPPAAYFDPLLEYLWQETRLEEFRDLLVVLRHREPADPYLLNAQLYLALLQNSSGDRPGVAPGSTSDPDPIGTNLDRLVDVALALCEQYPDEPGFLTTAALALYKSGNFDSARAILLAIPDDSWNARSTADRAILAFITRNSEKSVSGGGLREKIDPSHLNRLEQEVLLASSLR